MKNLTNLKTLLTLVMAGFTYFATAQSMTSYGTNAGTGGSNSSYFGYEAGKSVEPYICCTTFLGAKAGRDNTGSNAYLGLYTGQLNQSGARNTFLGAYSGGSSIGSDNVFVGYMAGSQEKGDSKLYIDNSNTDSPLIYGDFASDQLGIGTSTIPSDYTLAVKGKAIAEEVKIRSYYNWPDYVFAPDYNLSSLSALEKDIQKLGHLPGEDGFHLGEMDAILLEKVEELTLYLIEVNKKVERLETENEDLKSELEQIKN